MAENNLQAQGYYSNFDRNGWDLSVMRNVLDGMHVPATAWEPILSKEHVSFLVLGSATDRNLDVMALIDRDLRPGKGGQDTVFVIDYNRFPLDAHRKRMDFLDEWHASQRQREPEPGPNELPYPTFELVQSDMQHLPLPDGAVDIIVSDYTFNFLSDMKAIDRAFGEAARVLTDDGVMIMAVNGNTKYPYARPDELLSLEQMNDLQEHEMSGGTVINQFPLQTYLGSADHHGLQLVVSRISVSNLLCGILKKTKPL